MGRRKGVGEIKRHDFFAKTHWALLAHETPPFQVSGPNTPGWITSITSDPASVMDDKMATWTWNVRVYGNEESSSRVYDSTCEPYLFYLLECALVVLP